MIEHILWVVGGLVLLYFGAEWLVKGASEIALKLGVSPLIVGLTVVAFGTSAPELLVCLDANKGGYSGIALGNVIGSNICNIALVLGVASLIRPIDIHKQIIKREIPILVIATLVFITMLLGLSTDAGKPALVRWEGGVLVVGIVIYVTSSFLMARRKGTSDSEEFSAEDVQSAKNSSVGKLLVNIGLILVGLFALKFGSEKLVEHGETLARVYLNIDPAIIGLLLIAFGTSLPELATTVVAVKKGEGDLIVGNAVGSCIFNLLTVMGITALVKPVIYSGVGYFDLISMVVVSIIILPFMWSKMRLSRGEGGVLLIGYLSYCLLLLFLNK